MIQQVTFDNGLRMIVDQRDSPFVSVAYAVNVGAHDERLDQLGIAHLVEHLVFKGTVNRTVAQINREVDELGGELNAYTCEKRTVFFCTIRREHAEVAVDLLSDLVFGNTVPEEEFEREKAVVMEELAMYHDLGDNRVQELVLQALVPGHRNRWTVGGTVDSVRAFTRDDVLEFIDAHYVPSNVTVAITGGVSFDQAVGWVVPRVPEFVDTPAPIDGFHALTDADVQRGQLLVEDMEIGQSHVAFAWSFPGDVDARTIFTANLAAYVLGGGLGSRLGKVREQYGYCYTISCGTSVWRDALNVSGYMGINLANIPHAKQLITEILDDCRTNGLEDWEHRKAVNQLVVTLLREDVAVEDANSWKVDHLQGNMALTPSENCALVESITKQEVEVFIRDRLDPRTATYAEVHQTEDDEDEGVDD